MKRRANQPVFVFSLRRDLSWLTLAAAVLACAYGYTPAPDDGSGANTGGGSGGASGGQIVRQRPDSVTETGVVTFVVDGDTIEVDIGGVGYRVRYVGVNTPERDESCYSDAVAANAALVEGETVSLVRDSANTDRYGRLLRYVFVGDVFVNATLVSQGYAEAVEYGSDDRYTGYFRQLEGEPANARRACHATGIFDDGTLTR